MEMRGMQALFRLQLAQSSLYIGYPVIITFMMFKKPLYLRPNKHADEPVEQGYQKQLKFPMGRVL